MAIVTLPLPAQIANGQVGDATQVMADLNYIAAQVNANAQAAGTTPTVLEWQPLGQTPTFISATSFSVPADLTATLQVGRRLQTTNTAGTIYSTIVTASFGGGITTVTVSNDSGVLDSGLSVVNFGLLGAANTSIPLRSYVHVFSTANTSLSSTVVSNVGSGGSPTILTDVLGEWSAGTFTAKQSGIYCYAANVQFVTSGVTFSGATPNWQFAGAPGGPYSATQFVMRSDFGASQTNSCSPTAIIKLAAGNTLLLRFVAAFSAGTIVYTYDAMISRIGG